MTLLKENLTNIAFAIAPLFTSSLLPSNSIIPVDWAPKYSIGLIQSIFISFNFFVKPNIEPILYNLSKNGSQYSPLKSVFLKKLSSFISYSLATRNKSSHNIYSLVFLKESHVIFDIFYYFLLIFIMNLLLIHK